MGWQPLKELKSFHDLCCSSAKTPDDLNKAGVLFADAVGKVGVNTVLAVLGAKSLNGAKSTAAEESLPSRTRLPQDENANPRTPRALPRERKIGPNENQNLLLQNDINEAEASGATNVRVNQQQVNAAGERVGINRPDLQYTDAAGQRVYVEYDTDPASGIAHQERILANDPDGKVILKTIK